MTHEKKQVLRKVKEESLGKTQEKKTQSKDRDQLCFVTLLVQPYLALQTMAIRPTYSTLLEASILSWGSNVYMFCPCVQLNCTSTLAMTRIGIEQNRAGIGDIQGYLLFLLWSAAIGSLGY